MMNTQVVEECVRLSTEEKIIFPEFVNRLDEAGVESYVANMLAPNAVFYEEQEAYEVPLNIKAERNVAAAFNQENIIQALRAIQSKKIGYQEFIKQLMDAGVIYYLVFIKGRKAIYFGRNGEQYVEAFPSK